MYLIDVVGVRAFNFNRMGRKLGIQAQSTTQMLSNELGVDAPFRENPEQLLASSNTKDMEKLACLEQCNGPLG